MCLVLYIMMKKVFLIGFLILLMTSVFSSGISDYVVPEEIALGQRITATGVYEDGNFTNNVKCSFYFFDDANVLIDRATDEYTTATGRFVLTPFLITEPTFLRGKTYTLKTECGLLSDEKTFLVGQRMSIAHLGEQEFDFLTDPNNTMTAFIWFFVVLMGGSVLGFFWWYKKQWGRK